jgi:hypothetical protein
LGSYQGIHHGRPRCNKKERAQTLASGVDV